MKESKDELIEYLKNSVEITNKLRKEIPVYDKIVIPSFEIVEDELDLTEEQILVRDQSLEKLKELWDREEANSFVRDLIISHKDYNK